MEIKQLSQQSGTQFYCIHDHMIISSVISENDTALRNHTQFYSLCLPPIDNPGQIEIIGGRANLLRCIMPSCIKPGKEQEDMIFW